MAEVGKRRKSKSKVAYFRKLFDDDASWLDRPNEELKDRYLQDNPGRTEAYFNKIRQNIANLKSILRKKLRGENGTSTRRGASKSAGANAGSNKLEQLELAIDRCMDTAKNLDREGLASAINYLRLARNEVVWKMGQK